MKKYAQQFLNVNRAVTWNLRISYCLLNYLIGNFITERFLKKIMIYSLTVFPYSEGSYHCLSFGY